MIRDNAINVYTDGSSFPGPRSGGIGIRLVVVNAFGEEEIEDIPLSGYTGATNNQMELFACITGIKKSMRHPAFDSIEHVAIHSDSLYVVDNYPRALYSWSKNKWCNSQGKPVDNATFWKELIRVIKKCRKRVEFYWVKGHSKDEHNKAADRLAKKSARSAIHPALTVVKVRRKLSVKTVDPGCVPMLSQRISIRVITDEYLRLNKCFKYKYEVISKHSAYYGYVDFVYSIILLNAGHCYSIRFNDNPKNPTIVKMFKELPKR